MSPDIEAVLSKLNAPVVKNDDEAAVQLMCSETEPMWPVRDSKSEPKI